MGLYLDEGHCVVLEGDGILAVQQGGKVEIWSSDGEYHYGNLPENAEYRDVLIAVRFHAEGYILGVSVGEKKVRAAVRSALGL